MCFCCMFISVMKLLLICLFWNAVALTNGFYVPGVGPRDFMNGETVDIRVSERLNVINLLTYC